MKLSKNTWHYRWYKWWMIVKARSCGYYEVFQGYAEDGGGIYTYIEDCDDKELIYKATKHESRNHNICLYIKAVLLYAPTRYFFQSKMLKLITANIALYSLNIYMLCNFYSEFTHEIFMYTTAALIIAIMFGVVLGFMWCCFTVKDWYYGRPIKTDTFYKAVVKPYAKSVKTKMCLFIEFEEEPEEFWDH